MKKNYVEPALVFSLVSAFALHIIPANAYAEPEGPTSILGQVLMGWGPMLLLIGVWLIFMNKFKTGPQIEYMRRNAEAMERCEVSLRKIAEALERSNKT